MKNCFLLLRMTSHYMSSSQVKDCQLNLLSSTPSEQVTRLLKRSLGPGSDPSTLSLVTSHPNHRNFCFKLLYSGMQPYFIDANFSRINAIQITFGVILHLDVHVFSKIDVTSVVMQLDQELVLFQKISKNRGPLGINYWAI